MAIKKFNSKSQLFSMIALMMSLFFILLFSGVIRVPLDNDVDAIRVEVLALNEIVLDFPSLIESAAETSTLKILNFSVSHLNGTNYFSNFTEFFYSCFDDGTFYDYYDSLRKNCSLSQTNVSFIKHVETVFKLTGEVYKLGINVSNVKYNMSLFDAYSLGIFASLQVNTKLLSKKKNIAWNRKISVFRQVNFNGITDPASIGTNFLRKIRYNPNETTFTRVGFNGDEKIFKTYYDNNYYFIDQTGPSFIERMQGNTTKTFDLIDSNAFGIAMFIPSYNSSGQSLYLENVSIIDHHYDWGARPSKNLLRIFNDSLNINRNATIYRTYFLQGLGFDETQLDFAQGNCGPNGCI